MNNMHGIVLFLVFITSVSSTLCVSLNNDGGDKEIFTVVEDQATMHDAEIRMTKANPVQTGTFLLEDGKELKLSRKSSPGRNYCVDLGQPCGVLDPCCDPYYCSGYAWGTCQTNFCLRAGLPCAFGTCCGFCVNGFCVA